MPLTNTYCNTPINHATVTYYNCKKDNYFTLLYLELKNTGNIKEIKKIKKDTSKELEKKNPKKKFLLRVSN